MLKTSDIKSMAQILRDMKYPPVKEDTDKDEPGTQGDKEEYQRKRKEIAKKFGVESCSALKDEEKRKACYAALDAAHVSDDEEEDEDDDPVGKNEEVDITESFALQATMALDDAGVKSKWKKGKLYVAKRDIKKAEKALAKSFKRMKKGAEPDLYYEEVEEAHKEEEENVLDEAKNIKTVKLIVSPKPDATKTHAILLKMFPQENRNDLWDLARNMEDVGATLKENLKLDEIVKTKDKSVIDSFYDEKPLEGKMLSTDGKTLDKIGIGAQQIAKWNNGKITVTAKMDSKSTESILKYLRNNVPEKMFTEEIELDEGTAYPPTIENLRMIVKDKQHQKFMFPKGQAIVDLFTASAMVQVYDALKKPDMKKTFEKMIADKAGFLKTQAFAMKMIGK